MTLWLLYSWTENDICGENRNQRIDVNICRRCYNAVNTLSNYMGRFFILVVYFSKFGAKSLARLAVVIGFINYRLGALTPPQASKYLTYH